MEEVEEVETRISIYGVIHLELVTLTLFCHIVHLHCTTVCRVV